jgi:hypothetical protein
MWVIICFTQRAEDFIPLTRNHLAWFSPKGLSVAGGALGFFQLVLATNKRYSLNMIYRTVLVCDGVPKAAGSEAAIDIAKEFAEHRKWHANVACVWDGSKLTLSAESDYDPKGLALLDEFSDCLSAYIVGGFDGDLTVKSINKVSNHV